MNEKDSIKINKQKSLRFPNLNSTSGTNGHEAQRPLTREKYPGQNGVFTYMRSYDYKKWDIVMDGPYVLTKTK